MFLTIFLNFFIYFLYKFKYYIMARKKLLEEEKKSHLTINVNENLLQKLDKLLKEKSLKRSSLIEELLTNYINQQEK